MILFFALFLLALGLAMERLLTRNSLDAVREDHCPDRRLLEPEEVFHIVITLENTKRRFIPFVSVREHVDRDMTLHGEEDRAKPDVYQKGYDVTYTTWLRPRQQVQFRVPVSLSRRGQYVLHDLTVYGGDFLGLEEQRRTFHRMAEMIVAPREAPERELLSVMGGFLGEISVRRFLYEDPVLTVGYREYTGREPMKMISWSQSARGNGLMVKNYDHTAEPAVSVLLNVDYRGEDLEPQLERCFSVARTVCRILEEKGIQYEFLTNSVMAGALTQQAELGEGLGQRHFAGVLECLGRGTYLANGSGDKLLERAALASAKVQGRILITPSREGLGSGVMARLREASGGMVLVLCGSEVDTWQS